MHILTGSTSCITPLLPQTSVYHFEVVMCLTFIVLWGCTYPTAQGGKPSETEDLIQNYLNFIIFSILGGLAVVRPGLPLVPVMKYYVLFVLYV